MRELILVEDNQADVYLVRCALDQEGISYNLRVLTDGEAVIRFVEAADANDGDTARPDLMLLDLNLPCYSGEEIMERLRLSRKCANVPVIVLTSSDSPKDRERAASLGVADYFRKPIDYDDFMKLGAVVGKVLRERSSEAGA